MSHCSVSTSTSAPLRILMLLPKCLSPVCALSQTSLTRGRIQCRHRLLLPKLLLYRAESLLTLKNAILSNMLTFFHQPAVAHPNIWPRLFEVARTYSQKPTDMSVLLCHVQHFTTNTEPQMKWSKSDLGKLLKKEIF